MKIGVKKKFTLGLLATVIVLFISGCKDEPLVQTKYDRTPYETKACLRQLSTASEIVAAEQIDKIVVYKTQRTLSTYRNGVLINTFRMSLGKNGDRGHKVQVGDHRTPEGSYKIVRKKCDTTFYKSLMISYPNAQDKAKANAKGLNPGGHITIHGQPKWNADGRGDKYTLSHDWTQGCMAVSNHAIDILWRAVENGVKIEIRA